MDAEAYIAERGRLLDAWLDDFVPASDEAPERLHAAMRHLLFPGGKRLRPVLAMAGAEAVGGPPEHALPAAVAVELIHTYSLVHDDLPCMDDDDERRGIPTVNRAFDESTAVLAGDALQSAAFEALLTSSPELPLTAEQRLAAAREITRAVGSLGLVGGQVDDLAFEPNRAEVQSIESIHARKTAALIGASVTSGAILAGATGPVVEDLRNYGLRVGAVFQIGDDLLDAGRDEECSLLRVYTPDQARARAEELLDEALGLIEGLGEAAQPLRTLAVFVLRRNQ